MRIPTPSRLRQSALISLAGILLLLGSGSGHADSCSLEIANTASATIAGCSRVPLIHGPEPAANTDDDHIGRGYPPFLLDRDYFPSRSTEIIASTGFLDESRAGYFWSAGRGDGVFWEAKPSFWYTVNHAILNFQVLDNLLAPGEFVTFELLINDIAVGQITVPSGETGLFTLNTSFPTITFNDVELTYPLYYRYDVAFRVINEVPELAGSITLAYGDGDDGLAHSLELISEYNSLCADFDDFTDGVTFTFPTGGLFEGEVYASWENVDGLGGDVKMSGFIDSNWVGTFVCTEEECLDGNAWEITIDVLAGIGWIRDFNTGAIQRARAAYTLKEGTCEF